MAALRLCIVVVVSQVAFQAEAGWLPLSVRTSPLSNRACSDDNLSRNAIHETNVSIEDSAPFANRISCLSSAHEHKQLHRKENHGAVSVDEERRQIFVFFASILPWMTLSSTLVNAMEPDMPIIASSARLSTMGGSTIVASNIEDDPLAMFGQQLQQATTIAELKTQQQSSPTLLESSPSTQAPAKSDSSGNSRESINEQNTNKNSLNETLDRARSKKQIDPRTHG